MLEAYARWMNANLSSLGIEPWHLIAFGSFVAGVGVGLVICGLLHPQPN
jgi:hypothetical protein